MSADVSDDGCNGAPYCILQQDDTVRIITGRIERHSFVRELRFLDGDLPVQTVSMVPFSQVRERGFMARHENEPILTLIPDGLDAMTRADYLARGGDSASVVVGGALRHEPTDAEFETLVQRVIDEAIFRGEGSNFLISRKSFGQLEGFGDATARTIFRRLMENESGSYLTFLFFDGERYFIGASPERHLTIRGTEIVMNPVCGTLLKKREGFRDALLEFLRDPKEINELFQVVDETLKIMTKVCSEGGSISGPFLKEMRTLIHTHYELRGQSTLDPLDIFIQSMFAPTMVGSPLESAARMIYHLEPASRRYYSSALVIRETADDATLVLDSAITIRTLEIGANGDFCIQAGASIVRDSKPAAERAEITAKAAGALQALTDDSVEPEILPEAVDDYVRSILSSRNVPLSRFWIDPQWSFPPVEGRTLPTVLIIDNEDEFSFMMAHMLRRAGFGVRVELSRNVSSSLSTVTEDFVILGPGPGDPGDADDSRMRHIRAIARRLLDTQKPFLGVCLGHQVTMALLGFEVETLAMPLQGVQQDIDFFGSPERVGFYNTFMVRAPRGASRRHDCGRQCARVPECGAYGPVFIIPVPRRFPFDRKRH